MRPSAGLNTQALYEELLQSVELRFGAESETPPTLYEWVLSAGIMLDGKQFSFDRHEYLETPYQDDHPWIVEEKAAQMGLSVKAILSVLHALRYRDFRGVLYLMPSKSDITDFSRSRIGPIIEENPETIGRWVRDTDSVGLKQIHNGWLYLRGMVSRVGLKSIPVDMVAYDEITEGIQTAVDASQERMSHSEHGHSLFLSNPTLPDYSISKLFAETDQRYWLLKCPKCGHSTCLEDTFPDCLLEIGGRVIRACERCKSELDPAIGEWVAKRPSIEDKRGYHYSQLFSRYVDPAEVLHQFRTTNNLQDFYNLKIGVPYVEAENRLSTQEVLALCSNEGIASQDSGPCSMGVDQGKDLHVVIGKRHFQKAGKIVHIGIYRDWEELDRLMRNFNVSRCVVDALPETRNARSFAERHKGKIFLSYYNERQKGRYRWNEGDMTVQSNRTESLDASHREVMDQLIVLPKECGIVQDFAKHLHNVAKKLEEDEETGSKRYVYIKLGPDHLRHSFNFECMARQFSAAGVFADCDLS